MRIDHPPKQLVDGALISGLVGLLNAVEAANEAGDQVRVLEFESADPDFFLMHGDVEQILAMEAPADVPTEPNVAAATFDRCRTMGAAIIGANVGDTVSFESPADGTLSVHIVSLGQ